MQRKRPATNSSPPRRRLLRCPASRHRLQGIHAFRYRDRRHPGWGARPGQAGPEGLTRSSESEPERRDRRGREEPRRRLVAAQPVGRLQGGRGPDPGCHGRG